MMPLLSTRDLIARMTPTALAETIASFPPDSELRGDDAFTAYCLRVALASNVGDAEAAQLIAAAKAAN